MIRELAIRRNDKNKQDLITLDDNSTVEELIDSIQRVANLSYAVLETSISSDATQLSETALELSGECCDQFIMIIGNNNPRITPELKEKAKSLLIRMLEKLHGISIIMLEKLHGISQDENNLSISIEAVGKMIREKIIQQPWWSQYAQDHNYNYQGGNKSKSFKNQSKNKSNCPFIKKRNNKNSINRKIKIGKIRKKHYVYVLKNK